VVTVHVAEHTITVDLDDGGQRTFRRTTTQPVAATRPNARHTPTNPSQAWGDHRGHHRWSGAAYGSTPPAPRVLRIADATALRAALDPGAFCRPLRQDQRQATARPLPTRHPSSPEPEPEKARSTTTRVEPAGPYVS
jgi:hypothetical protein